MAEVVTEILSHAAADGYPLKYRLFHANGETKATVIFVHGIQSHGGWYESSCKALAKAGYRVLFLDRRGSGLNESARGDSPSFRTLLDDLADFIQDQRSQLPQTMKLYLGGISWGGKIVLGLETRRPGMVDGFMLIAPGFCPKVQPSRKERIKIALSRVTNPRKLFNIPLNDPELFTGNPVAQKFLREDPLALRQATARFLLDSVRLDLYLRIFPRKVPAPVLLVLAGHDRIIDNEKTRKFVQATVSGPLQVVEYPEAHHTLEFEPEPGRYIQDMLAWLDARYNG